MFQTQAHARSTESDRWSLEPTPARHPKKLARYVSSERARRFKLDSSSLSHPLPLPPRRKNGNRLALRNASFEEDRQATPSTGLDPGPRSPCGPSKTCYDVLATLDAPATTRFKRHPPSRRAQDKVEIRFGGGDTILQGRWFCARSFKTAVGPV